MFRKLLVIFFLLFLSIDCHAELRSLKNNKVNVRLGPAKTYPIKFVYQKKYLPVLIMDEHYNWRKIKDYENDSGWVHISQLSKQRTTVTLKDNLVIFTKPTIYSKPKAKLEIYQTLIIDNCKKNWCYVKNSKIKGWLKKNNLWEVKTAETIE